MLYRLAALLMSVALCGCDRSEPDVAPDVVQHGAMRAVMREGLTEARISMTGAAGEPHAYAVGALEGLDGEITIVDGEVWIARPEGEGLVVTGPGAVDGDQATLLTLAHVAEWRSVPIETSVEGSALESLIEEAARARGIDTSMPFPFVIEGELPGVDLHVTNGYCPIATDPSTVDAQPWSWTSPGPIEAVIVGFYAPDAGGVMTHHGTSIHAHAVLQIDGKTVTGHMNQVSVVPGMTLRVPAAD